MAASKEKAGASPVEPPIAEQQVAGDYNDPARLHPSDPNFAGQGLDMSVYGNTRNSKE
ncbi:hypothetical protein [Brevundimonas sp.]|uniref:hypothetical protein n=1 Tax=Brevundimonas sp. TaxID=1871086 RepID=UPI002899D8B9|nr:hypothetical protein [Brevundimonas sp.]